MATIPQRVPHAASRRAGAARTGALALAFATVTLGGTLPTPLYGLYAEDFDFTTAAATVVYGAYAVGTLLALLLFGRLSDVVGRRPLVLAACGLGAASSLGFLLADDLPALLAARVLSGLSVATAAGAVTAYLVDLDPDGDRSRAARLATLANFGGLAAGPLLAGVLAEITAAATQVPFVVHLILLTLGAGLVLRVPETVRRRRGVPVAFQRLSVPESARGAFVLAAGATAAAFAVFGVFAGLAARFVRVELGSGSLLLVGVAGFAVFAAAAAAPLAVARLGPARALHRGAALLPVALGLLVGALVTVRIEVFLASALLGGTGAGLAFVAALARVAAAAPTERRAEAASSLFVIAYAAMSLPVVGIGVAAEAIGLLAASAVFAALTAVLAAGVLITHLTTERTSQLMSRLPTKVGHVHLKVADLERSVAFYSEVLGLGVSERVGGTFAFLTFGDEHHDLALQAHPGAEPAPSQGLGLYHSAFEVDEPAALAEVAGRLERRGVPYSPVDHGISKALYFADPDGNGVEVYLDTRTERAVWGGVSDRFDPHAAIA